MEYPSRVWGCVATMLERQRGSGEQRGSLVILDWNVFHSTVDYGLRPAAGSGEFILIRFYPSNDRTLLNRGINNA